MTTTSAAPPSPAASDPAAGTGPATHPAPPGPATDLDALAMALNCAASVTRVAEQLDPKVTPLAEDRRRLDQTGKAAARLGGDLALVAIAADVRRIADSMTAAPATTELVVDRGLWWRLADWQRLAVLGAVLLLGGVLWWVGR